MEVPFKTTESGGIITASNNMNSKINKRFAQLPENLRLNGVTPSGKPRLFVCNICTRAFARQEHLIRHKRSHTNEKPYVCVICDRRFSRRDLLLRHAHKLHGGDCAESLVRKCSPTRRRLSSVVRRRKGGESGSADGGKSRSGSGSEATTVVDEEVGIEVKAGRSRRRRISFSAQSGESYASAACHETGVTNDADKVQFSTPQLLPIDLTQESSSMTPLEANQWVNDINNLPSLDSAAMARCSTSTESTGDGAMETNPNRPPSSMFMWQKSKVKSLFSHTSQSPPTAAARISSISSVQDHSRKASTRNTSSPRSCEGSEGSETNEFRFLPGECNRGSSSRSPADQAFTNDIVSTFDKFMRTGYSFYGLENPDLTSTIMRSSVPQMDNVCKAVQYTDIINCNFFTQELRSMCSTALEYYSLHCIKCSSTTASSVTLPSCRELNLYLSMFINHFASHIPFIHPQLWQSDLQSFRGYIYGGMENAAVSNDYALQCSHIVCLPLLAATMGSMYTKSYGQDVFDSVSSRTSHMYEISRRVLHVFLETRNIANLPLSSLWLAQSLMLSILYSLIVKPWEGTSKQSSETVVKQLSAVCTMVRRDLLPAIGFTDNANNLNSPAEYIFLESKIRATLLCYNICQSLRCFYNITSPNFLKEADLDSIMIPDEEAAWNAATLDFNTSLDLCLATQKALKGKKNTMLFGKFYQTFTFSTLGAHAIPEYLATTMLYYEFSNTNSAFHIFLTKIDTKKLEVNLPFLSGTSQDGANATPTSVSSENTLHTTNLFFPIDPIKSLSQDAVILKNGLMCMVFFKSIDPNYGWQIGNQCVENMFNFYLDPGKFNILVNGSYKLITDFLVSLNFSIQNISSIIQSFETPILDSSRTSISNLQCYYFNFLVIIKFILDFERTPNFKLLCIYTELKKLANKLFIPALSNCYPLEFAKFLDSDSELLGLWKDPSSSSNIYQDYGDDSNFPNGTNIQNDFNNLNKPQQTQRFEHFNAGQLEKLINNVLVYSFNDSNFLSMPENAPNEFVFNSHPKVSSLISPPSLSPKPTVSSLNLLRFHHELNRTGKKVHQTFADHYHLAEKYVLIAKCIYLHAYESYIYSNFLKGLSDNFQTLERLLLRQNGPEPKIHGDALSKMEMDNNGSSVQVGDLFSNHMTE